MVSGCKENGSYGLEEINYKELSQMVENKESFMLEVMQDGCSACQDFTPRFESILKDNKLKAYKINLTKMTVEERKELDKIANVSGTPNVIFLEEGEEESLLTRISGAVSNDRITNKLKANGYIK